MSKLVQNTRPSTASQKVMSSGQMDSAAQKMVQVMNTTKVKEFASESIPEKLPP